MTPNSLEPPAGLAEAQLDPAGVAVTSAPVTRNHEGSCVYGASSTIACLGNRGAAPLGGGTLTAIAAPRHASLPWDVRDRRVAKTRGWEDHRGCSTGWRDPG